MIAKQFEQTQQVVFTHTRVSVLAISLITTLAAILRSLNLGTWSFATDEIFTLHNAQNLSHALFSYRAVVEHPITSSLILLSTNIFGVSEWSARLAPVVIGTMTIPIVYLIVQKEAGTGVALLASFMLALSPWHLFWSQSARFYVLLLLFYTLALLSFYRGVEKNRAFFMGAGVLWTALAISERLLAIFLGPVVIVYFVLLLLLPIPKPSGVTFKNMLLLLLPGLFVSIFFAFDFIRDPALWQRLYMSWVGRGPLDVVWDFAKGIDVHIVILAVLGALYGLRMQNRFILLLAVNIVVPLGIVMVAALFQFTHDRYLFVTVISSFVLAAYGAVWLVRDLLNGNRLIFGVMGAIILLVPFQDQLAYHQTLHGWRIDWRSGFEYALAHADADALLMSNNVEVGRYYAGFEVGGLSSRKTAVSQIKAANKQTWFVIGGSALLNSSMHQWIIENGRLVHTIQPKIEIHQYVPPDS